MEMDFFREIRKIVENFRNFGNFFLKIPKSVGIFQKILNISKKFLFFTQKWCKNNKRVVHSKVCENNRSDVGAQKMKIEFFQKIWKNFFEKPTSYWNLKKNWKIVDIFSKNFKNSEKFLKISENYGKFIEISRKN